MLEGKVLIAVDSEMTCHQIQAYLIHGSQKVMRQLLSKLEEPQQSKEVLRQFYKNLEKIASKCVMNLLCPNEVMYSATTNQQFYCSANDFLCDGGAMAVLENTLMI